MSVPKNNMPTPKTPLRRTRSFDDESYHSGTRPAFLSFRQRQFSNSLTPSSIDGITPIQNKTNYINNSWSRQKVQQQRKGCYPVPAELKLHQWSPVPNTTPHGSELQTPVLIPSESPIDNSSIIDTPPSIHGPENGQALVGKIRNLQSQLERSEKEKNEMKEYIRGLQQQNKEMEKEMAQREEKKATQEREEEEDRRVNHRLSTNSHEDEENESISSDNNSADETIIQCAMTQIQSGVYQLEKSLRRLSKGGSLSGSTGGSWSSDHQTDFGGSGRTASSTTDGNNKNNIESADVVCGHGTPSWWSRLQCGDMVDGRDKDRAWYAACVESIESCNNNEIDEQVDHGSQESNNQFRVLISFEGWSSDWDIWLHSKNDIAELAPRGTHVNLSESEINNKSAVENEDDEVDVEENNVSTVTSEEDGVNLSRTQVGSTPEHLHQRSPMKSWVNDDSLSPVEYVQSLGGSSGSTLRHEIMILQDGRSASLNLKEWRVADVLEWCQSTLELPQYVDSLEKNSVDGMVLFNLSEDDLKELGIKNKMHILKFISHLDELVSRSSN
jgi:hypothetical protein